MRSLVKIACIAMALGALTLIAGCESCTVSRAAALDTTFGQAQVPSTYRIGPQTNINAGPRERVIISAS